MRRYKYVLIISIAAVLLIPFLIKPIILYVVKQGIQSAFTGSSVSIGDFSLDIRRKALLSDLRIYKKNSYDFKLKQLKVEYSLSGIRRGNLSKMSLAGLSIDILSPKQTLKDFARSFIRQSGGSFFVEGVELSGVDIKIKLADVSADAKLFVAANLRERSISRLNLAVDNLEVAGFRLADFNLVTISGDGMYRLGVRQIEREGVKFDNLSAEARLSGNRIIVSQLSGQALGGSVAASAEFVLASPIIYSVNIETANLDMVDLLSYFKVKDKFEMTGRFGGRISIQGSGEQLRVAAGNLIFAKPGGTLTIKDSDLLNNIAAGPGQSSEIVRNSFKDYIYNTGAISTSLSSKDLNLGIALEGSSGKRNFNLVWHDFKLANIFTN